MLKEEVKSRLDQILLENPSLFLIDFSVSPSQHIKVVIDGDEGVTLEDCMKVSRAIEHNLDRESTDFSLEVTSPGATEPLEMPRQYTKNIGRKLEVKTSETTITGTLVSASAEGIKLEWKAREPKPVGKGKTTVLKSAEVPFTDIVKANVVLKF
ncbi:ribosome assembly cofactor RimP [Muriicola marianensis]|uniref:Ribosome maturation factor RimP n=1 Tax=Muriicola marianensis TaxID=1324801 RepID=A0ABQ1QUC0_9FLAO|nr:ribosome assembly cofactor RimP [Muriicola marianensis]GGD46517.1 ribosome maturation factor RimP [Muriicola marianensis]